MKLPSGALTGLEDVINAWLRLDPCTCERLAGLEGRCIGLDLQGFDLRLYILPGENGIRLRDVFEGEPDTVLYGTSLGMARLGLGASAEKTLFSGSVTISGDVETGQAFKQALDAMDIDWEEQLSRLTGDVVAHQICNAARRLRSAARHTRTALAQDSGEYLTEELRILPSRIEVENFSRDVDILRMAADRLAARVRRLHSAARKPEDR
jgi:ubiquinone biosynthesis protein UbiJ